MDNSLDKVSEEKQNLITEIMQVVKVGNIVNPFAMHSTDKVLLELICLDVSALKKIAHELNIKIS